MNNVPLLPDKPILVSAVRAREILDVGVTKFWAMVKAGKIRMADTAGRRMVVYASLEALANGDNAASK
jgi:hypothetical protein